MSLHKPLQNKWMSIGIGLVFGPLAYNGAQNLGSIQLINGLWGLVILSCSWGLMMLVIHIWKKELDKRTPDFFNHKNKLR